MCASATLVHSGYCCHSAFAPTRFESARTFRCCGYVGSRSGSRSQALHGDAHLVSPEGWHVHLHTCFACVYRPNLTESLVAEASQILDHNGVKVS